MFLAEFYPPSRAQKLVAEILSFNQDLLHACPQHDLPMDKQLIQFYSGLTLTSRNQLDASLGGSFLHLDEKDAQEVIEVMAANSSQWPSERQTHKRIATVKSDTKYDDLLVRFNEVTEELEAERKGKMMTNAVDSLPPIEEANFVHGGNYLQYHQGYNKGGQGFNNKSHLISPIGILIMHSNLK